MTEMYFGYERQQGAALLVSIVTTLMMASMMLMWMTQQLLSQHDGLQRQRHWFTKQQSIDQMFNQQAQAIVEGRVSIHKPSVSHDITAEYHADFVDVACFPLSDLSQCWQIRISWHDDSRWQTRVLRIPGDSCGQPYWVADLSERGHVL